MKKIIGALIAAALAFPVASFAADGATVWKKCAPCHGADGKGGAKKLRDIGSPEVQAKSDAQLTKDTVDGIPEKKMPAYKGKLTDDEVKAVVAHMRTFKK